MLISARKSDKFDINVWLVRDVQTKRIQNDFLSRKGGNTTRKETYIVLKVIELHTVDFAYLQT